jgi:hypothetical protein
MLDKKLIEKTVLVPKMIEDLVPYALNPVSHSEYEIANLSRLIKRVGFINPIIIDENEMILAGHRRALACMRIDLKTVNCLQIFGLTHAEKIAYITADNKMSENHNWDADLLRENVAEIMASEEFDISSLQSLGFNADEFDMFDIDIDPDKTNKPNEKQIETKELSKDDFSNFEIKCPRCGFEFDEK